MARYPKATDENVPRRRRIARFRGERGKQPGIPATLPGAPSERLRGPGYVFGFAPAVDGVGPPVVVDQREHPGEGATDTGGEDGSHGGPVEARGAMTSSSTGPKLTCCAVEGDPRRRLPWRAGRSVGVEHLRRLPGRTVEVFCRCDREVPAPATAPASAPATPATSTVTAWTRSCGTRRRWAAGITAAVADLPLAEARTCQYCGYRFAS